ncbi:MAG: LCP family protein [Oscillospiraceae bacterium]|nr:LCP family protein [Oscillospiraceae bacterium]
MSDKHNGNYRNTDNEETQFFSRPSDNQNTAEFSRPVKRPNPQNNGYPHQQGYGQNPQNNGYPRQQSYGQNPQNNGYPRQQSYGQNPQNNGNPRQQSYGQNPQNNGYPRQTGYSQGQPQSRNSYYDNESPINMRGNGNTPPPNRSGQNGYYRQSDGNRPQPHQGQPNRKPPKNNAGRPQNQPVKKKKKQKRRKKFPFVLKLLIILLIIIAIPFGLYSCASLSVIKKLNYVESESYSHSSSALSESYVTSILLVGTDGRSTDERGRSDTMILLSINSKTKEITLTSLMRDSYVEIPGRGWDKLTNSYSYGGIDLLMQTIENNFGVRIDDYISVNFSSFAAIVDAVGGIEIEVSDSEAKEINTILQAEVNELMGDAVDSDLLSEGGKIHLNGKQALSYARIRHVGNADFERTERQRNVLTQIAGKLKSIRISGIKEITDKAVPNITTNMTTSELYLLSLRLPFCIGYNIEQIRIPSDGTYSGANKDCGSVLVVDFDENYKLLEEEVFSD